jgi:hypothetical protein
MLRPAFPRVIAAALLVVSSAVVLHTSTAQSAQFTATPSRSPGEAFVGLSNGARSQDSGFAATASSGY